MTSTKHEGREVRQHQIKVTNTGDGLSQAVAVDPIDLHLGEKVYALIECVKTKDGYEEINGGADLKRVHTLKGGSATLIEKEIARPLVEAQIGRIVKARDDAANLDPLAPATKPAKSLGDAGAGRAKAGARKAPAKKAAAKKAAKKS